MSSNPSLHITRSNYEEYFLLYVDNELSAGDRAAVDAFVLLHPDLQEELALLGDTKLEPDFFPHFDKESLRAPGIAAAALEEDLLSYIDGELPEAERLQLETLLRGDAGLQAGHAALLATKLDPLESVPCPFKQELYREEPARRRAYGWWRAAAAVLLLAGAGTAYVLLDNKSVPTPDTIAQVDGPKTKPAPAAEAPKQVAHPVPSTATVAYGSSPAQPAEATPIVPQRATGLTERSIARAERRKPVPTPVATPSKAAQDAAAALAAAQPDAGAQAYAQLPERVSQLDAQPLSQQNINSSPVTDAHLLAYTTQNSADSEAVPASLNNGRQGSVRGFLRKATRFLERRTGIKATNDDDQLVLGAVAINLK